MGQAPDPKGYLLFHFEWGRTIYISAAVCRGLAERADLYEYAGVLALAANPGGRYHLIRKSGTQARVFYAQDLADYLSCRFPGHEQKVWAWRDGETLLFGPAERYGTPFTRDFRPLDLSAVSRCRADTLQADRLMVTARTPARSRACALGQMVALVKARDGTCLRENGAGRSYIRSQELAAWCRRVWGERPIFSRTLPEGPVFSTDFSGLLGLRDLRGFLPLRMERGAYLELRRDRSIRLSARATELLAGRVAVYACGGSLAVRAERDGELPIRRRSGAALLFSIRLYQQLLVCYPLAERLYLYPHGRLLALSGDSVCPRLPPEEFFCRLSVAEAD